MRLVPLRTDADAATAQALVREYVASLERPEEYEGLEEELAVLTEHYGPPGGTFLLVYDGAVLAGCGALRRFDAATGEVRRLYVRPTFRGRGVGRALMEALVQTARGLGYRHLLLDTLPELRSAQALYRSLGFQEIAPYYPCPAPDALYFALDLAPPAP